MLNFLEDSMTRYWISLAIILAITSSVAPIAVQAQPAPQRQERMNRLQEMRQERRGQIMERIRQLRVWKLTDRLKLTEDQSVKFFARYNRYQDEFAKNLETVQSQMRELRQAELANASEADIDKKVMQVLEARKASSELLPKYYKEFREVLSARQMAELVIFERDFLEDLNVLMRQAQKRDNEK